LADNLTKNFGFLIWNTGGAGMITTCTICQARYQLDGTKVPKKVIRVRCPECSGVFVLDGAAPPMVTEFQVEPTIQPAAPAPDPEPIVETQEPFAPEIEQPSAAVIDDSIQIESNNTWDIPDDPADLSAEIASAVVEEPAFDDFPAKEAPAAAPKARRRRSKEEMLARALVSDILVYNRDLRDKAIKDGKLLEVLGGEIKKSWELYKEKVTPDVANSTNHFREALNEILAEGEKVF
jgi:predicted Zn finger-like uncharacterized protein